MIFISDLEHFRVGYLPTIMQTFFKINADHKTVSPSFTVTVVFKKINIRIFSERGKVGWGLICNRNTDS